MKKITGSIVAILLALVLIFGSAVAEEVLSLTLTGELDAVKTKHDNGFIKTEALDSKDPHSGWGLGEFYIQGFSEVAEEADGTPVFLMKEGDQIVLGFRLKQDIDALNGDSNLRINEDKNGYDTAFDVKKTDFGRGCLILQKTEPDGHVNEPAVIPDYLAKAAENSAETTIGPLEAGNYSGQLDYEIRYKRTIGISGYNDYKIPLSFKIKGEEDYYQSILEPIGISLSDTSGADIGSAGGAANTAAADPGTTAATADTTATTTDASASTAGKTAATTGTTATTAGTTAAAAATPSTAAGAGTPANNAVLPIILGALVCVLIVVAIILRNKEKKERRNGEESGAKKTGLLRKICVILALLLIVALCVLWLRPILTNAETYSHSVTFLEERLENANKLVIGSGSASFIVSMFPDDTGTPIANQLAKISSFLLVVISAILLEKYLITAMGLVASVVIFPLACLLGIGSVLIQTDYRRKLAEYAVRVAIFGICILLVIPLGCIGGRAVEDLNRDSINRAMTNAREANSIVEQIPEGEKQNIFSKVGDFFSGIWNSATQAYDWGKTVLANYMSSVAVMLVTTIAVPILLLLAFIWTVKYLTRKDFAALLLSSLGAGNDDKPADGQKGEIKSEDGEKGEITE